MNNAKVDFENTFLTTYYTLELINKNINRNTKLIFTSSSAVFGDIKKILMKKHLLYILVVIMVLSS